MMRMNHQRGALSLFWCAVLAGVLAFAGIGVLLSMRYERNLFAEAWSRAIGMPAEQALRQTARAAEGAVKPVPAAVSKCIVDGKVLYSNVECDVRNPTSRKVDLHDTHGIESPRAPEALPTDAPSGLQEKILEKAIEKAANR